MIVRRYKPEDAYQIQAIYDRCHQGLFGIPRLDFVISSVVVEQNGKIVGYGALERIIEGIMILDTGLSTKTKIKVLDEIIDSGIVSAKLHGYERFYVFPSPDEFADLLTKHFNFKKCDPIFHLEL